MRLVNKSGGFLFTFTCSGALAKSSGSFEEILSESGKRAGRTVRILDGRLNSPDHPYLASYLESVYLKSLLVWVT
jgi:23S rRNA (cytosine1962-C5)-methyltransferase